MLHVSPGFSTFKRLRCTRCGRTYDPDGLNTVCPSCGGVLYPEYDLEPVSRSLFEGRPWSMGLWRYHELLPIRNSENIVSLGEGATPLIKAYRLASKLGLRSLYIKDESLNRLL